MSQTRLVKDHLDKFGTISPLEARHVYGIERLASRVDELRRDGVKIFTRIKLDARGKRYAEYVYTV